jgi:hypothetical protein
MFQFDLPAPATPRRFIAGLWCCAALSLTGCGSARYGEQAATDASALLKVARAVTHAEGLPAARELVVARLRAEDDSRGELERRVLRTTRDPDLVLPDSLAALSPKARQRLALVIVPGTKSGFGAKSNLTRDCLFAAAEKSREMGFDTHFIQTLPRGTVEDNARLLADQIRPVFESADQVALVMLSKGAHDVIHYLQEHAARLAPDSRAKLTAVLSLAGTLQGSVVADWFAHSPDLKAISTRAWLCVTGQANGVRMLQTVAHTPWRPATAGKMGELFPNLTWVSVAMVPDGPDGTISERLWAPKIRNRIQKTSPYYSPTDGLVETAAAVLPDQVTVSEWIVLALGSHALPNGHYLDGSRIAPLTTAPGEEDLRAESGGEVMSAYLRALPRSLLH